MSGNPFEIRVDTIVQENEVLQRIQHAMKEIRQHEALIGIPQEANTAHKDENGNSITDAELLYIHSYGSPINKIPPRDALKPSMEHHQTEIADVLGDVLAKATEGNLDAALTALKRAGTFAEGKAKDWFTNSANRWAVLDDDTIRSRQRKMSKNKIAAADTLIAGEKKKGNKKAASAAYKPLIDSGELRKSITSVVRRKGKAMG